MELVEGDSPKGPIRLESALAYARQIADALEAAHEKDITHRDLKPANIKSKPTALVLGGREWDLERSDRQAFHPRQVPARGIVNRLLQQDRGSPRLFA
jgi:hypothetical protein